MKVVAFILVIISLSKLCIASSFERQDLINDLSYAIRTKPEDFQKVIIFILMIDSIIGIICGFTLWL